MQSTIPVGEAVCDWGDDELFVVMADYYELVDDLVAGRARSADDLREVLTRSGRRMQELQEDSLYFSKRGEPVGAAR